MTESDRSLANATVVAHGDSLGAELTNADSDEIVNEIVNEIVGTPGATVTRRPFAYASSSRLEAIDVTGPDGRTMRLVAKHLGRRAMTDAARRAKPEALHCAERELAVYRHVLAGADLGTPLLVGGWASGDAAVLVLERVEGTPLTEIGDFAIWEAVARWLARMHCAFPVAPRLPMSPRATRPALLKYDRELLATSGRRGLERAAAKALGSAEMWVALDARHEYALRALASATVTLVHGDFYPSNIVVAGDRIAVVDWELAGAGPGALDLAALLSGGWSSAQRAALLMAYHQEALRARRTETLTALARRVELASLHLALRWVGAAPDWEAPDEHCRDWFADALAALARLDGRVP